MPERDAITSINTTFGQRPHLTKEAWVHQPLQENYIGVSSSKKETWEVVGGGFVAL